MYIQRIHCKPFLAYAMPYPCVAIYSLATAMYTYGHIIIWLHIACACEYLLNDLLPIAAICYIQLLGIWSRFHNYSYLELGGVIIILYSVLTIISIMHNVILIAGLYVFWGEWLSWLDNKLIYVVYYFSVIVLHITYIVLTLTCMDWIRISFHS